MIDAFNLSVKGNFFHSLVDVPILPEERGGLLQYNFKNARSY